jgi:hypothetical protein
VELGRRRNLQSRGAVERTGAAARWSGWGRQWGGADGSADGSRWSRRGRRRGGADGGGGGCGGADGGGAVAVDRTVEGINEYAEEGRRGKT